MTIHLAAVEKLCIEEESGVEETVNSFTFGLLY